MAVTSYEGRRTETLEYVQAMLAQLCAMATAERADMLAYMIEMAYIEATDILRGEQPQIFSNGSRRHDQGNRSS